MSMDSDEQFEDDFMVPEDQQPDPDGFSFDLVETLSGVLSISSQVPVDGFTAHALGTEREGNAILIDETGLVLTIGYLIAEADRVWLTAADGSTTEGHVIAYDFVSGFGLVQAFGVVPGTPMKFGDASAVRVGDQVVFAGRGGLAGALKAQIVSRREFAGYWEYLLEEAFFTVPPHPSWGGAAVLNSDGALISVGSLFVGDARGHGAPSDGNMSVPITAAEAMISEWRERGRVTVNGRPWLGAYMAEVENYIVVAGLSPKGPGEKAGLETGDVILEVADSPIGDLSDYLRTVWSLGDPGVIVPLTVIRDSNPIKINVQSADRGSFLKAPRLH